MRETPVHTHDHGLGLLVADDDALERTLRHCLTPYSFDLARDFAAAFGLADFVFLGVATSPLAAGSAPARFCAAIVFMRAMSRRMTRTRDVFSSCPVARWKRRLNCSFLSLTSSSSSWSTVICRRPPGLSTSTTPSPSLGDARDEARLDRQLGGGERQRLARHLLGHAVDLEQHAARLDSAHPQFRRALALAHAHLDRLPRHRHVRKSPDPHPAGALHMARHGAPRRFDLPRVQPVRLHGLEAIFAEAQGG